MLKLLSVVVMKLHGGLHTQSNVSAARAKYHMTSTKRRCINSIVATSTIKRINVDASFHLKTLGAMFGASVLYYLMD